MPTPGPDVEAARFAPRAGREMAEMFDQVSDRYDLLNRVMSLGQDAAWRRAMWRAVPAGATAVLDLCTGSGVSLPGLRKPGRLVIGADVSLQMLERAAALQRSSGWAPRLVCADAFSLPLRDGALDAITIAFGIRNLRPGVDALGELARVMKPGGVLAVLEASAPRPGLLAPIHGFYLRRVVPWAGRLSGDPSAYRYLGQSILEFGSGPEFERDLAASGFAVVARRSFLLGAARLWVARRRPGDGQFASIDPDGLQNASLAGTESRATEELEAEWRTWTGIQALLSGALFFALGYAAWVFANWGGALPLSGWQHPAGWVLIGGGLLLFGTRTIRLVRRIMGGRARL
jgi:demethylmenaquinone methyltransferase/2-methoxy-6-polyprenyl-1,4-benzoquinol methylase